MPVSKVIMLAPKVELMVLANVQLNTFQGRMTLAFATVDQTGEPVRGGAEITDTLTDTDFDEIVALMIPTVLPAIAAKMVARGKLAPGASIVDVDDGGSPADGGSPQDGGSPTIDDGGSPVGKP